MVDKYTDDKLYRVIRKKGCHLNTKTNLDGSKSALQFKDENNKLSGPVDLIEIDEEELIREKYSSEPSEKCSIGEKILDELVVPVIREATIQLLEYGVNKMGMWVENKAIPAIKLKIKTSLKNIKLYISTLRDSNKVIKAEQLFEDQCELLSLEKENTLVLNKKGYNDEKEYILSAEDVELLLDRLKKNVLMIVENLRILNNSVVMDDGTDTIRIAKIQRDIEQLSSKDVTKCIDLLLEDKNAGLIDDKSVIMLRAFRNGMFVGNGTPIPISKYIDSKCEEVEN